VCESACVERDSVSRVCVERGPLIFVLFSAFFV